MPSNYPINVNCNPNYFLKYFSALNCRNPYPFLTVDLLKKYIQVKNSISKVFVLFLEGHYSVLGQQTDVSATQNWAV